jgi:rubrerythrin
MPVFNCRFCNYKTEKSVKPAKCPYCSKKDAMVEEESAGEILDCA